MWLLELGEVALIDHRQARYGQALARSRRYREHRRIVSIDDSLDLTLMDARIDRIFISSTRYIVPGSNFSELDACIQSTLDKDNKMPPESKALVVFEIARLYGDQGRLVEAIDLINKAVELHPVDVIVMMALLDKACFYKRMGKQAIAEDCIEDACELREYSETVRQNPFLEQWLRREKTCVLQTGMASLEVYLERAHLTVECFLGANSMHMGFHERAHCLLGVKTALLHHAGGRPGVDRAYAMLSAFERRYWGDRTCVQRSFAKYPVTLNANAHSAEVSDAKIANPLSEALLKKDRGAMKEYFLQFA